MAANYTGPGERFPVTPGDIAGAVTAGSLQSVGAIYGVAIDDAEAGGANVLLLQGTYRLAKATGAGTGGAKGTKANATGGNLITAGAGTYVGFLKEATQDGDAFAEVTLLGFPA